MIRRALPFALLGFGVSAAHAEIHYRVTPDVENKLIRIDITAPVKGYGTEFQIPNWAPGHYAYQRNAEAVADVKATDARGRALKVIAASRGVWEVPGLAAGEVTFSYTVPGAINDNTMHYNGPTHYMYVVNRKTESCRLDFVLPKGWKIATGLDSAGSYTSYTAPNYDTLADNPVTLGLFTEYGYMSGGRPHTICLRGEAKQWIDQSYLTLACKFVSDMQTRHMGGAPYHKYVWHFLVNARPDGAGGLEHLSSTEISLSAGIGPGAVGVLSHEFFHLWNVKRIRSKVLGPFDYTQLPQTGALWWLEGVTDYFAHTMLGRYGWNTESRLLEEVSNNIRAQRARRQRLEVSPYEASFKVRDAANGQGNSNGFGVSYYDTGFLVGLILDAEIMSRSNGKYSLDDVLRKLWEVCREDQPGFEEDEIRKQLIRFGGDELGAIYDRIVMKPGELPLEDALLKFGYVLSNDAYKVTTLPFRVAPAPADGGLRVTGVNEGSGFGDLKSGDLIVSLNGVSTAGKTTYANYGPYVALLAKLGAGAEVEVRVLRDKKNLTFKGKTTEASRTGWHITPGKSTALRELWLKANRH